MGCTIPAADLSLLRSILRELDGAGGTVPVRPAAGHVLGAATRDKRTLAAADEREFWERAEQRNAQTAKLYDELGLQEYEAIESFVRWDGRPLD
jgi:hypothetical protein